MGRPLSGTIIVHELYCTVHSAHTFLPEHLVLGTNVLILVDCHLPSAIPNPTLDKKIHIKQLNVALPTCQTVAQHYVATSTSQAPNLYVPGVLILVASTQHEKAH